MTDKLIQNLKGLELYGQTRSPRVLRSRTIPRVVSNPKKTTTTKVVPEPTTINVPESTSSIVIVQKTPQPNVLQNTNLILIDYSDTESESDHEYSIIDEPILFESVDFDDDKKDDDDETNTDDHEYLDDLEELINDDGLSDVDDRLFFSVTSRNNPKLCFGGYYYTIDKNFNVENPPSFMFEGKFHKNGSDSIHWKCENANDTSSSKKCNGRVHTSGFNKFLGYRIEHNHQPNHDRKFVLKVINECKALSRLSNENPITILQKFQVNLPNSAASQMLRLDSIRQIINRVRSKLDNHGTNPVTLDTIDIPNALSYTYNGTKFLWDDSGKDDDKRILIFSTKENFKRLDKHRHWYVDGTFDISPHLFKQVFSIHIIFKNKVLPMVYALLPDKTQSTYTKLFTMVKCSSKLEPLSITCDFELATINAVSQIFPNTLRHGCYFHLCQSLYRNVQTKGLGEYYMKYKSFRDQFKWLQALPFVPANSCVDAFKVVKSKATLKFKPMIQYFESNYIGKLKEGSKTFRQEPRFPIALWNVYDRVVNNLPRTNNSVESWHSRVSADTKKHLGVLKIIELFRIEEKSVEIRYIQLSSGEVSKRKKKSEIKD